MTHFWLRSEDRQDEFRTPISPKGAEKLLGEGFEVSVEDCEMVSKHVSKVLDTVNGFSENYILEVSSPGLDRKFFYNDQYEDYINQPLKVTFLDSQNKKTIQGRLQGVDKTSIRLEIKEGPMQIAFSSIIRANLII